MLDSYLLVPFRQYLSRARVFPVRSSLCTWMLSSELSIYSECEGNVMNGRRVFRVEHVCVKLVWRGTPSSQIEYR